MAEVLEKVAQGEDFEVISEAYQGAVRSEAIEEAMRLARETLLKFWLEMGQNRAEKPPEEKTNKRRNHAKRVAND